MDTAAWLRDVGPERYEPAFRESEIDREVLPELTEAHLPGIGKSRLARSLLERLSGEPHPRLCLFCSPHHEDSALYPTITQLERAAGVRGEAGRRVAPNVPRITEPAGGTSRCPT
jgi:hypothetical protein